MDWLALATEKGTTLALGAIGAGAAWSLRARMERWRLSVQIRKLLNDADPSLHQIYQAIEKEDQGKLKTAPENLIRIGRALEARLSRYITVYDLSNKASFRYSNFPQLAILLEHLGILMGRYFEINDEGVRQGKQHYTKLHELSRKIADTCNGIPEALDEIREGFGMSKTSKELKVAQQKALKTAESHRHTLMKNEIVGDRIFLKRTDDNVPIHLRR